ncbi:hypothetical protein NA56DRAFT_653654 [Hyaloscypha hepaticicola]|uniref:Uncharacterized protein n=1 Tax=Hyaloscypha hepaticicola TaxID=2082293 RepID=A0A2J6QNK0_9HELO|nr:hypothetical protein NA56DRAFT_653654 [Hyaloscypha hepaticicola]
MDIQSILNMSPLPKPSKRPQCFSESDSNDENPSKRISYPIILADRQSSASTRPDSLSLQASLDDINSAVQSEPSAITLPPISDPLMSAEVAESRRNPPYLPPAEIRMSLNYICSDRALPPVSYAGTATLTPQLDLDALHQLAQAQQDSMIPPNFDLNSPTFEPISPTFEPLEDYVPQTLIISPATLNAFKQFNLEQLDRYDYIEIIAPASLRSARVAFANNFEIIIFDLSHMPDGEFYEIAPQAGWLIVTSSCPRQLVVKDRLGRSTREGSITPFDFRVLMKSVGFRPKARAEVDGMYWVWEKDTFEGLSWTWQLRRED